MNLLRFITAGSVDDGKSTLIGRLLYDSKSIYADQLEALGRHGRSRQTGEIDLSLLTDGLRAEREQGITIDVAYRYFSTPKRKFIIIDAPGHIQYTRNLVTGASNAELMIILIDARHGVVEQTRRHAAVASLLDIPQIVVAVNKMDLIGYSAGRYQDIISDFQKVADALHLQNVRYLPVSAVLGENIVTPSSAMPWYEGPPLLPLLEDIKITKNVDYGRGRMSVQYVVGPPTGAAGGSRHYAGRINSGIFRKNEVVMVLPSGVTSRIKEIEADGHIVTEAFGQQSVMLRLDDQLDISRGDLMVTGDAPCIRRDIDALAFWMDEKKLLPGNRYLLQLNSRMERCVVSSIEYRLDISTMARLPFPSQAALNDIVQIHIRTAVPMAFDPYEELPENGRAILIDETSNATVGACILQ